MPTSVKQLLEAANAAVPRVTPAQAKEMIAKGNTVVVDVRDGAPVSVRGAGERKELLVRVPAGGKAVRVEVDYAW